MNFTLIFKTTITIVTVENRRQMSSAVSRQTSDFRLQPKAENRKPKTASEAGSTSI